MTLVAGSDRHTNKVLEIGKLAYEDLEKSLSFIWHSTNNIFCQCKVNMNSKLTWRCVWMEATSAR